MKHRFTFAAAVALLSAAILSAAILSAQPRPYQPPTGPAPKLASGKPDLNGVWARPYTANMEAGAGGTLPYTDWGKKEWETYNAENGDYTGACLPVGETRSFNGPDPIRFMQTDNHMAFLIEQNTWFMVFPLDGRPHDPKKVPTWFGESIGHWEGDTLVVVSKNFNGFTKLDTVGHPLSDKLVLTEKFTRTDLGHMNYEVIVDDPKTYTKPWSNKRVFTLRTDWEVEEYSCEENNKGLVEGRIKIPDFGSK